jgi:hypothetical protein
VTHLPNIDIRTINHYNQKYPTAGDYFELCGNWHVRISRMKDWRYEFLVLMHELTEMALTKHHNIDWELIDEFDIRGKGATHPDPGTLEEAPYHNEHALATQIEKKLAKMLGVDWETYDLAFEDLEYPNGITEQENGDK